MRSWTRLPRRTALLPGVWNASIRLFDAAEEMAYGGKRKIEWFEVFAGEKYNDVYYDFARLM